MKFLTAASILSASLIALLELTASSAAAQTLYGVDSLGGAGSPLVLEFVGPAASGPCGYPSGPLGPHLPFPTTIGGGATTVELAHQVVWHRRQSKSLKLAGLASDWADRSCLVASRS